MKQCTCYALRAIDCTCKPAKYGELYTTPPAKQEQGEPVTGETDDKLDFYSDNARNEQQRKLVGKVEMGQFVGDGSNKSASNLDAKREVAVIAGFDEYGPMLEWSKHWIDFPIGTKFYTTPQQRTWVGLDEEDDIDWEEGGSLRDLVEAVEAKLKEKNT